MEMLSRLLMISVESPDLLTYDCSGAMNLWWTLGQRLRRPQFGPSSHNDTTTNSTGNDDATDDLLDFFLEYETEQEDKQFM